MPRKLKLKKRKRFVELTETVNAIPKGVYNLEGINEDGASLYLGRKIHIGLIGPLAENYLLRLTEQEGRKRKMKEDEFLANYYELLEGLKGKDPDFSRPFTYCMLDPSLARELH